MTVYINPNSYAYQDDDSGYDGRFFSWWRNTINWWRFSVSGYDSGFYVHGHAVMDNFGNLVKVNT